MKIVYPFRLKRHMEKHKILELNGDEEPSECSINGEDEVKRVLVLGAIINNYMSKK